MNKAYKTTGFIVNPYNLPNEVKVLEIVGKGNYEDFKNLPDVLKFNDELYGKSSYNSDTNIACYRNDKVIATSN